MMGLKLKPPHTREVSVHDGTGRLNAGPPAPGRERSRRGTRQLRDGRWLSLLADTTVPGCLVVTREHPVSRVST